MKNIILIIGLCFMMSGCATLVTAALIGGAAEGGHQIVKHVVEKHQPGGS